MPGSMAMGTPRGGSRHPRTTSCLSSRVPWSPHLYRVGAGAAGRSELQTGLPSSLRFSASAGCGGQGGDSRRARGTHLPPVHRNLKSWTAGGTRDTDGKRISPSFPWQISHFQGCVWARGPRTLKACPSGCPGTHVSLEP